MSDKDKCTKCNKNLSTSDRTNQIQCEMCKVFFHLHCLKLNVNAKSIPYACSACEQRTMQRSTLTPGGTRTQSRVTLRQSSLNGTPTIQTPPPPESTTSEGSRNNFSVEDINSGEEANGIIEVEDVVDELSDAEKIRQLQEFLMSSHSKEAEAVGLADHYKSQAEDVRLHFEQFAQTAQSRETEMKQLLADYNDALQQFRVEISELKNSLSESQDTVKQQQNEIDALRLKATERQQLEQSQRHEMAHDSERARNFLQSMDSQQQNGDIDNYRNLLDQVTSNRTVPSSSHILNNGRSFTRDQVSAPTIVNDDDRRSTSSGDSRASSTMELMFIRQSIDELPEFSGLDISEWIEFEVTFDETTSLGQFSESENVKRLKKCLKVPARDMVDDMFSGSSATAIMNLLRDTYGRPEEQLAKMIKEVNNLPKLSGGMDSRIRLYSKTLSSYVTKLKRMKVYDGIKAPAIEAAILEKLVDSPLYYRWLTLKRSKSSVSLEDLAAFMKEQWMRMPAAYRDNKSQDSDKPKTKPTSKPRHVLSHFPVNTTSAATGMSSTTTTSATQGCVICGKNGHTVERCFTFKSKSVSERDKLVREKRLCFCCLKLNHRSKDCGNKEVCGIDGCTWQHHRLLHLKRNPQNQQSMSQSSQSRVETSQAAQSSQPAAQAEGVTATVLKHVNVHSSDNVLAKVIGVRLYGCNGKYADTYAYLDDGSHITMIEKELASDLELPGSLKTLNLQWTKNMTRKEMAMRCALEISGLNTSKRFKFENVYAVDEMSLPTQTQDAVDLCSRYRHLKGLKIPSFQDAQPRILIGLDQARFLSDSKPIESSSSDEPVAVKTKFGWVVYGQTSSGGAKSSLSAFHIPVLLTTVNKPAVSNGLYDTSRTDHELHELVRKNMTTESFGVSPSTRDVKSREDERAEAIMKSTLKFVDGRYEIGMLWKTDDIELPDSYRMAFKRLERQEESLKKKPDVKEWMNEHVKSLITKGYARVATETDLNTKWKRVWYCPMFVTYNMNKSPPKPRCVWDVAAKNRYPDGVSLNSCLLSGPDNLASLMGGLTRFREQAIAVNGDVKEMFHQVKISLADQQCQRFLWRDCDPSKKVTIYVMESMAFGPTDSPSKAQFVKNFHAEKYRDKFPEASDALQKFTYVDDYFNSHATVEEAIRVTKDAIKICGDMKFDLVGVQSNNREVLKEMPQHNVKEQLINLEGREDENYITKVLGMHWDATNDTFFYQRKNDELMSKMMTEDFLPTKRETLRVAMRTFDPLGLVAKYIIRARMVLQDIWRSGIDWDDKISEELAKQWRDFIETFDIIEKIRIPRNYAPVNPHSCRVELITFVDASDRAFAAVCYFRFVTDSEVFIALAGAKAKVAPVNPMTIPRLELQAALIGVREAETVAKLHSFEIAEKKFLSDSTCVLSWICNPKSKQDKFIGSRIGEILDKSSPADWFHVRTNQNVADEATKPTKEDDDVSNSRWFKGPEFLKLPTEEWPISRREPGVFVGTHAVGESQSHPINNIKSRLRAKWKSIVHTVGYMLRLKPSTTPKPNVKFITAEEFQRAELTIFRKIQADAFGEEMESLLKWKKLPEERRNVMNRVSRSSTIHQLLPYIDDNNLIRMGSRNQSAIYSYAARNPVILPTSHELVDSLIEYHHKRNHHFGVETMIADLRETVWILAIRQAVLRVNAKCQWCRLNKAKPERPISGQLHEASTAFKLSAFSFVGADCFGPILVKHGRGTAKRWVVLFTCLTFRAIHMEILRDMSSDKMLGAIRRMIGRRGKVQKLYSDNGTNFTGANNTMRRDHEDLLAELGRTTADELRIDWHFIAAYSPWMGGAWESLIKLVKRALNDCLTGEAIDEDVLANALIEAEIIINNRPLTHTPTNPEDDQPLTPNFQMFGSKQPPSHAIVSNENDIYSKDSHYKSQALGDRIAARWIREYLPEIARRSEKSLGRSGIQLDDVVLVTEPNLPRSAWKLGRVVKIHPSKDEVIRVIDVKLKNGTIEERRSVGRCALIDTRGEESTA